MVKPATIAVAGCSRGCGVTHLTVAIANCLASAMGKKTAVLEAGSQRCFRWLKEEKKSKQIDEAISFMGIDFFSGVNKFDVPVIQSKGYDYIVFDMGKEVSDFKEYFVMCDKRIVVCSLQKWNRKDAEMMMERFQNPGWGFIEPKFYTAFFSEEEKRTFEKKIGTKVLQLPWIKDPFHLAMQDVPELRKIITD